MKNLLFIALIALTGCMKERNGSPLPIGTFVKIEDCERKYIGPIQTIAFMDGRCYLNDGPMHVIRYEYPALYWSISLPEIDYYRSGKVLLSMSNDTLTLTGGMAQVTGCEVAKFKLMH